MLPGFETGVSFDTPGSWDKVLQNIYLNWICQLHLFVNACWIQNTNVPKWDLLDWHIRNLFSSFQYS